VISTVLPAPDRVLLASMWMVRIRGSAIGRTKSIDSKPLSNRAPITSMPSASMNANTAMEKYPVGIVIGLLAADRELVFHQFDGKIAGRKARHGENDAQAIFTDPLDIVRRVALGILGQSVERALKLVEAQQQG
jgi:hypothetical protein